MPPKALYTFSVGLIIVILETKRLFEGGGGRGENCSNEFECICIRLDVIRKNVISFKK